MRDYEMEDCTMRFERLTDLGPKGAKRFWGWGPKTPEQLGVAFVLCTNPKSNCRLERTTSEMTGAIRFTVC